MVVEISVVCLDDCVQGGAAARALCSRLLAALEITSSTATALTAVTMADTRSRTAVLRWDERRAMLLALAGANFKVAKLAWSVKTRTEA